jgi:hypothetical protein
MTTYLNAGDLRNRVPLEIIKCKYARTLGFRRRWRHSKPFTCDVFEIRRVEVAR